MNIDLKLCKVFRIKVGEEDAALLVLLNNCWAVQVTQMIPEKIHQKSEIVKMFDFEIHSELKL